MTGLPLLSQQRPTIADVFFCGVADDPSDGHLLLVRDLLQGREEFGRKADRHALHALRVIDLRLALRGHGGVAEWMCTTLHHLGDPLLPSSLLAKDQSRQPTA